MSREILWDYALHISDLSQQQDLRAAGNEAWDKVLAAVDASMPRWGRSCGASSGPDDRLEYTFMANRAKARRIAARLDAYLGLRGVLSAVDI